MTPQDFFAPSVTYRDEILVKVTKKPDNARQPIAATRGIYRRGAEMVAVASVCVMGLGCTGNAAALASNSEQAVTIQVEPSTQATGGRFVRAPPDLARRIDTLYRRLAVDGNSMSADEYKSAVVDLRTLQTQAADLMEATLEGRLQLPRHAGRDLIADADRLLKEYADPTTED